MPQLPVESSHECNFEQTRAIPWGQKYLLRDRKNPGAYRMTKLTHAERADLPKADFVFPKTRRYPIEDAAHARDALARSSGKPEHTAVAAAVSRKFPEIEIEK
jgi:hypothetical protein